MINLIFFFFTLFLGPVIMAMAWLGVEWWRAVTGSVGMILFILGMDYYIYLELKNREMRGQR